jgi:hypothetical protein
MAFNALPLSSVSSAVASLPVVHVSVCLLAIPSCTHLHVRHQSATMEFPPDRTIVLSTLSDKEKDKFFRFFVDEGIEVRAYVIEHAVQ